MAKSEQKGRKVFILMDKNEWLLTLTQRGLQRRGLRYSGKMNIRPMIMHERNSDGTMMPTSIRLEVDLVDWEREKHKYKK